jgi:anaerobic dimethyl sulfoxide reductase subunit A
LEEKEISQKTAKTITTTCNQDCGARCFLKVTVRNGRIVRIASKKQEGLNITACPRGLVQKEVVNHPDRLLYPLKRTGPRGGDGFKVISWDEALDTIAAKIKKIEKEYGTESIYFLVNTGAYNVLHNTRAATNRFFGMLGRCTAFWCNVSMEAAMQSSLATFGTPFTGSSRDNILHSRLIILWGWDPDVTRFGSDTAIYLSRAKKEKIKIICVDPRMNRTCKVLGDEWIPLKPGTDTALLIAMANVLIEEDLYDRDFIERYTVGFDKFYDYVMGLEDEVVKDPQWAHPICGVSPEVVKRLAREYALAKPAALMTGWAPGRSAYGEQFQRAASVVAAMTGNIGVRGGFVSGGVDLIDNGVIDKKVPVPQTEHNQIHKTRLYDALINGRSGGYPADCKLLYITGCNLLNQYLNLNKGIKALSGAEFTVIHEFFLTHTARFADIVLPVTHAFEHDDIGQTWIGGSYFINMNRVVEPPGEVKSDFQIFSEIAERLGITDFNDMSDDEWLKNILKRNPEFPDLEALRKAGIYSLKYDQPKIAFREQVENPEKNPFPTQSGKIEIYSSMFAEKNDPLIPPIPKYIPPWEGPDDKLMESYPIQLISPHSRARINSQLYNVDRIKHLGDDFLWLNPEDAEERNIEDGDLVHVYNDRGRIKVKVRVTDRIIKGVASLDQGQWYNPGSDGVDHGGCVNVLTTDKHSPAGAFPSNSCLVQVEKV